MSAPPTIDTATLNKIRELLHLGKKIDYIANRLQIPRPHIIEAGFGDRLRYRAADDTMTAAPAALDLVEGLDPATVTEHAEYGHHPRKIPAHLLPPPRPADTTQPTTPGTPEPPAVVEPAQPAEPVTPPVTTPAPARVRGPRPDNRERQDAYRRRIENLGVPATDIRTWARDHHMTVCRVGFIPAHILDAYENRNNPTARAEVADKPAEKIPAPIPATPVSEPYLTPDIREAARHVGAVVNTITTIQHNLDEIYTQLRAVENDACQLLLGIIERT